MRVKLFSSWPYFHVLASGVLINVSFFWPNIYTNVLALFSLALMFYGVSFLQTSKHRYFAGLIFFGAWLLPTTYWYYNIFPWWLAIFASFGFVTLIAHVFRAPFPFNIFAWILLEALRMNLPVTQDWWIPSLIYTQWQNPLILQIIQIANIYGVLLLILCLNAFWAHLFLKKRTVLLFMSAIFVAGGCLVGNYFLQRTTLENPLGIQLLLIQTKSEVLEKLEAMTISELDKNHYDLSRPILVAWPENELKSEYGEKISSFVRDEGIYVVYDMEEANGSSNPFEAAVLLSPNGEMLLTNYKQHMAPSEKITESEVFGSVAIDGMNLVTDVCYDLHYLDISRRLDDNDFLIAPVDDAEFGSLLQHFHAADVVFRAIRSRINIVTSATTGPTMFVNKYGVFGANILPFYKEGALFVQ